MYGFWGKQRCVDIGAEMCGYWGRQRCVDIGAEMYGYWGRQRCVDIGADRDVWIVGQTKLCISGKIEMCEYWADRTVSILAQTEMYGY